MPKVNASRRLVPGASDVLKVRKLHWLFGSFQAGADLTAGGTLTDLQLH